MVWTLKGRGLAVLVAAPLLAAAPFLAAVPAYAGGPGPNSHKGDKGSTSKPAPRPRTHAKPKAHGKPKGHAKPRVHAKPKGHAKSKARVVVFDMKSPRHAVVPGRTYAWTFTMTAKGPGKSGKVVFRTTLPKSLAFVSGEKHCKPHGRTVVCRFGRLKDGQKATGAIRAKVSRHAEPGDTIGLRGTVTCGRTRTRVVFPAVRVARATGLALLKR